MLPTLKKPSEAVGLTMHVPGAFWEKCPAADKSKVYICNIREFDALHKFAGGQPPVDCTRCLRCQGCVCAMKAGGAEPVAACVMV